MKKRSAALPILVLASLFGAAFYLAPGKRK